VAFDWTVLGSGLAILVLGLTTGAVLLVIRAAPHLGRSSGPSRAKSSSVARAAEAAGLPLSAVVGVRLALEQGRGRTAVPVRSALVGTATAVTLVVAKLTFASGLSTLVTHPPLYGWNWNYTLEPTNNMPLKTLAPLGHDREVTAWSGADYTNVGIDGLNVPVILEQSHAKVAPPVLSGHGLDANNEILVGSATLNELQKRIGDSVYVSLGTAKDRTYYIRRLDF